MNKIPLFAAFTLFALTAHGQAADAGAPYIGGALSLDGSNWDELAEDNLGGATTDTPLGVGLDIYGGMQLNAIFGARLGYRVLGEQTVEVITAGSSPEATVNAGGLYVAADALFPLSDQLAIGGILGLYKWDADVEVQGLPDSSEDGTDAFFGLVGRLTPADASFHFDVSYTLYKLDSNDINDSLDYGALSGALTVRF